MNPVLLCTDHFRNEYGARLAGLETVAFETASDDDLARVTIAFMSKDVIPDGVQPFQDAVVAAPQLDWFHSFAAGTEGPLFETLRARGVRVTRSAGASAHAIAETVFMFLHGLSRDLRSAMELSAARRFEWHMWSELEDRSIAVLGYGPIGQRIIELALAYGMRPTIVRRSPQGDEPCPTRTLADLEEVATQSDVFVVALPLNSETRGVVSRRVIECMQPHCLVVNVARGAIVDQAALTDALTARRIAGAGLDVFETEPLPATDPLWDLPNVLITPHNAGSGRRGPEIVANMFFANLALYLEGKAMNHELPR